VNVVTIRENGGSVTGFRSLESDGIGPWEFRGAASFVNSCVYRGLFPIRKQSPEDDVLPVQSTWGYKVISIIAECRFVDGQN